MFSKLRPLIYSSTSKDTLVMLFGGSISTVLGFLITVLLARNLSGASFGLFITSLAFIQLVADIFEAGTNASVFNFVPSSQGQQKLAFIKATFTSKVIVGLAVSLLVFLLSALIAKDVFRSDEIIPFVAISSLGVFLTILMIWGQTVLQAERRFLNFTINNILTNLCRALLLGLLLIYHVSNPLLIFLIFQLILLLPLGHIFLKLDRKFLKADVRGGSIRKVWKFSIPLGIGFACWAVYTRLDQVLIFNLGGAKEAGIYGVAFKVANIIIFTAGTFGNAISPRLASLSDDLFGNYFKKTLLAAGILGGVSFLPILIAPFFLPLIFGERFVAAVLPFQILSFGSILFLIAIPFSYSIIYKFKNPYFMMYSSIFYLVLLWVLLNLLIPPLGSVGAALGVLLMYAAQLLLSVGYYFYCLKVNEKS